MARKAEPPIPGFGERVRLLRRNSKISAIRFAELFGINRQSLYYYESGKMMPSYPTIIRIADLFGVSVDYLLGRHYPNASIIAPSIPEVLINGVRYTPSEEDL